MNHILLRLLFCSALLAETTWAASRTSPSYEITSETADQGGGPAVSASYGNHSSAGKVSGRATSSTGLIEANSGYVAQLAANAPQAVSLLGIVSRKTHGEAGAFDVNLPVGPNPGLECRSGGAGGNHQIIFFFSAPVTVNTVEVASLDGQAGGTYEINGATVTVNLSAVSNAQRMAVGLLGINGGGDIAVAMRVLIGDTNGDGTVNSGDALQTRNRSGQTTNATNFRSDVNADGFVNSGDALVVKGRSGTAIPD